VPDDRPVAQQHAALGLVDRVPASAGNDQNDDEGDDDADDAPVHTCAPDVDGRDTARMIMKA
jgi:hypothetical protein